MMRVWRWLIPLHWSEGWRMVLWASFSVGFLLEWVVPSLDPSPWWQHDLIATAIGWPLVRWVVGMYRDVVEDIRRGRG